ncbi:unnamed protein product [Linum tenue]|uniref:Uncharacterized protein n=1 Tax=Linum tenue TaxID=586396 RepID=A0AAV0NYD1_9ROSI|nr:unnamed protein product [Linum tenue]
MGFKTGYLAGGSCWTGGHRRLRY